MPTTPNYSWITPTDGGSSNVWGDLLNDAFDAADADVYAVDVLAQAALPKAGGTMTGNLVAKTTSGTVVAKGSISGAQSLDQSAANAFTATISGSTTFSFTNVPSNASGFVLKLTAGSTGVTWPASVKWAAGAAPTLSAGVDILGFLTFDGGTLWYGIPINLAAA